MQTVKRLVIAGATSLILGFGFTFYLVFYVSNAGDRAANSRVAVTATIGTNLIRLGILLLLIAFVYWLIRRYKKNG